MDIFELIQKDHEKLRKLLERLAKTKVDQVDLRHMIFGKLHEENAAHTQAEEKTFYAALLDGEMREQLLEALEEHRVINLLIADLDRQAKDEETWGPRMRVMKELVEHHLEEEEDDIFDEARKQLDDKQADDLAGQFRRMKAEAQTTAAR